jgi:cytochrome c biogenesis protein CcmG, thiol:disulfide interchange protein DsbE
MKRIVCAALATAALICGPALADERAQIGKPAPAFVATTVDGNKVLLRQFAGRPIFMNFFATWCPPCKLELPNIVKHYPEYKKNVVFLGFDQEESPDLVKPFLKQFGISYTVGIDQGQVAASYGVAALPQSVFIDKNGIVRAIWRGYLPPATFLKDMQLIDR